MRGEPPRRTYDAGVSDSAAEPGEEALPEGLVRLLGDYERHLVSERDLAPHTVRAYLGDISGLLDHCVRLGIHDVTDLDLRAYNGGIGIEGVEKRIRTERIVTPADWDEGLEIHRGATFNLAHNLGQMLHLRPRNRFEDLEGVYLVGGGTHPGSGLPVIFQSARITAELLARDLGARLPGTSLPAEAETELARAV